MSCLVLLGGEGVNRCVHLCSDMKRWGRSGEVCVCVSVRREGCVSVPQRRYVCVL